MSEAILTLQSVVGIGRIQRLCLVIFLYGMGAWVAVVHLVQLGIERGLGAEEAGTLLVYLSIGSASLRLPLAYAADRCGRQVVWAALLAVHACMDLVCASSFEFASSRAFLSGFAYGVGGLVGGMNSILVSLPSEMRLSPLASRLAVPIICSPLGAGMLAGPFVAGAIRSATAQYSYALLYATACFVGAFVLYTSSLLAERCGCTSDHDGAGPAEGAPAANAGAGADGASSMPRVDSSSNGLVGATDADGTKGFGASRPGPRPKPVTV